jgi:xylulokinase
MTELTIGVDVATANVRALAVDAEGHVVASAHLPLPPPVDLRDGGVEQEPVHAEVALAVIARVVAAVSARIRGVAVTATSGSVVPTDPNGRAVGPVLPYSDTRGARESTGDRVRHDVISAAPALGRIAWMRAHRPAPRYLHVSDLVCAALAGAIIATDNSHALKSGVDPVLCDWPAGVLDAVAVPRDALPPVAAPGEVAGVVGAHAAAVTGLPPGTPIVLGMTDGCSGQIAAGAVHVGDAASVLGTTLVLKAVASREVAALPAIYSHRAPDGRWWPGGASNIGAGALRRFGEEAALRTLGAAAARHGPAAHIRYPLERTGERFPFDAPSATGFTVGEPTGTVDEFRGVLEGIAFTERLGYEIMASLGAPIRGPIRSVGGGTRGREWLTIRATALGRPIIVPSEPASAFGAAVLAASATVHDGLADAVGRMVRLEHTAPANDDEVERLDLSYRRFVAEIVGRGWLPAPPAEALDAS